MAEELYLSAAETAKALRISLPTLYAYVSRGMIRSQRVEGTKRRLYWRGDVERLRRTPPSTPDEGSLDGRLVRQTKITLLTPQGHFYRGEPALSLTATATLEDIAALLWEVDVRVFDDVLPRLSADTISGPAASESVAQRTMRMLFAIEQQDARAYNLSRDGYCRSGVDALRCVAAASIEGAALSADPIHIQIGRAAGADEATTDIVRQYLVLAADHELDPTTYAVRAAANTGVTPYAAIAAGLVSAGGRRLVFGRTGSIARMFEEIDTAEDPSVPLIDRIRVGEPLPGFGSAYYKDGDPRAVHLLGLLRRYCADDDRFRRLETAIATIRDATGDHPSFVVPAMFLERMLGMPASRTTVLRIARVVGWVAHAMEQYYDTGLIRPHADYSGKLPRVPSKRHIDSYDTD